MLRHQTGESVGGMLSHVTSVLDILTNSRTRHLLLIKNSPRLAPPPCLSLTRSLTHMHNRYLERLATSLLSYNQLSHRATAQVSSLCTVLLSPSPHHLLSLSFLIPSLPHPLRQRQWPAAGRRPLRQLSHCNPSWQP